MDKNYLFVSGCGRSGTTLVAKILGAHPSIVIGVERYMRLFRKNFTEFKPELFKFNRYFDFKPGDSGQFAKGVSVVTEQYYENMRNKWDGAHYVGDKIPILFERFNEIHKRFFPVKVMHITRYIDDVVCSWDAHVKSGILPPAYDYKKAVEVWNSSLVKALQYHEMYPGNISLIDYERLLDDGNISKMLKSINENLDAGPINEFIEAKKRRAPKLAEQRRERVLSEEQKEYIGRHARLDLYKECVHASVFQ